MNQVLATPKVTLGTHKWVTVGLLFVVLPMPRVSKALLTVPPFLVIVIFQGEVKYHKYYQWVCFVLYLQAAIFYFPRYIWKYMEGGKIKMLVQELQVGQVLSGSIM